MIGAQVIPVIVGTRLSHFLVNEKPASQCPSVRVEHGRAAGVLHPPRSGGAFQHSTHGALNSERSKSDHG